MLCQSDSISVPEKVFYYSMKVWEETVQPFALSRSKEVKTKNNTKDVSFIKEITVSFGDLISPDILVMRWRIISINAWNASSRMNNLLKWKYGPLKCILNRFGLHERVDYAVLRYVYERERLPEPARSDTVRCGRYQMGVWPVVSVGRNTITGCTYLELIDNQLRSNTIFNVILYID